ncbi:craniofacial development protein 1-like [Argonauta hians]
MSDNDSNSSSDLDYIPSDAEDVSVEEEESLDEGGGDDAAWPADHSTLNKSLKRKRNKTKSALPARKRRGGIRLEGELPDGCEADPETVRLEEERRQQEKETAEEALRKHKEDEKRRSDSLWQSFLSDVGHRPFSTSGTSGRSSSGSLASLNSPIGNRSPGDGASSSPMQTNGSDASSPLKGPSPQKVTITKVYDFAGEKVEVSKEVAADSKEAKEDLLMKSVREGPCDGLSPPEPPSKSSSSSSSSSSKSSSAMASLFSGKRPGSSSGGGGGGGLGGLLSKITKKNKLSTLEKSKLDWNGYKQKEGIESELQQHNRSKNSYLDRMAFLDRTDHRQFEIEKTLRLGSSSSSSRR